MIRVRTSDVVRTMRGAKSYRSCPTSTGLPMWGAELGRRYQQEVARCLRELRYRWLVAMHRQRSRTP